MIRGSLSAVLGAAFIAGAAACYDSKGSTAGVAVKMESAGGDQQSAEIGDFLPNPLAVRVLDDADDPVEGVRVQWEVIAGGGFITQGSDTDGDGIATATFRMGGVPGSNTARAFVNGLTGSPVVFTASGTSTGADDGDGDGSK